MLKALGLGRKKGGSAIAPVEAAAAEDPASQALAVVEETSSQATTSGKRRKKRKRGAGVGAAAEPTAWTSAYTDDGIVYYINNESGESAWELPAGGVLTDEGGGGGMHDGGGGGGMPLPAGERRDEWVEELKRSFRVPGTVARIDSDRGKRIVFPDIFPVSPLVRLNVLEAQSPLRHKFTISLGDLKDEPNDYWQPAHTIFVFATPMPNTRPYTIELRREPFGTRLRYESKTPQSRDISKWKNYEPPKGFYTFPDGVPNTVNYALDWCTGPDRYVVTREPKPMLGWLRCLRFQGYAAHLFHVCENQDPCVNYRVHKGGTMVVEEGWRCLFAFYAFEDQIPGTTRYYVQEQYEPHYRIRVGKEPTSSHGWLDYCTFCAFDVALPGTAKYHVDYLIQGTDTRTAVAEQSRLFVDDAWDPWQVKLEFYAYPAPSLVFDKAPGEEEATYQQY